MQDDKPVNLIVIITVPMRESEVDEFKKDLKYELGMLFTGPTGFDRQSRIEMVTNSATFPTC